MEPGQVRGIVREELERFNYGFEDRLASSFQRALDTVLHDYDRRIRSLEEDLAKLMRHTGLE